MRDISCDVREAAIGVQFLHIQAHAVVWLRVEHWAC